jgi:transposase InsO family protein
MNDEYELVEKKNLSPPRGTSRRKKFRRYPAELKFKAVKMFLEEGFNGTLIAQQLGISAQSLSNWARVYRELGEEGLRQCSIHTMHKFKLPPPVAEKIVELKKENPSFGIKRISHWLRRCFLMQASPETVRQHLHQAGLIEPRRTPKTRNLTRPRFFERATPNQMWQTDIFTFRLGGRYAYLIGFMDDYSRFITAADLFRSPTAQAVIEVYRIGIGEFKPPKEMLTDNGRQYTSWRGTSRFEAELKKDGVAHFKSRPHHPMTLGKIERFWESIWQEFLNRAQFDSFDNARERIKLWIKYYNHKRPHQGIEGLCPADRFFEIQTQLRQTLEKGIQDNLLEMALRGQPRAPFYMVGRMEGQSVVLRAEKGKLKLSVSNETNQPTQELTYDLHQNQSSDRQDSSVQTPAPQTPAQPPILRPGQSPGDPGGLDRPDQTDRSLPANADQLGHLPAVAEPGDGGDVASAGKQSEPGPGPGPEPPSPTTAQPSPDQCPGQTAEPAGTDSEQACVSQPGESYLLNERSTEGASSQTSRDHSAGPFGPNHGHSGSPATGCLPQDLLPMGEAGPGRNVEPIGGSAPGPTGPAAGCGETSPATEGERIGAGTVCPATDRRDHGLHGGAPSIEH